MVPLSFGVAEDDAGTVIEPEGRLPRAIRRRRERHPGEPWRWGRGWESGRIPPREEEGLGRAWLYIGAWGLTAVAFLGLGMILPGEGGRWATWGGLALLVMAALPVVRHRMRATAARRSGPVRLVLESSPVEPGGVLRGSIRTGSRVEADGAYEIALVLARRSLEPYEDGRRWYERILEEHPRRVVPDAVRSAGPGVEIPVEIELPPDARESDYRDDEDYYEWRLSVSAPTPGLDFGASFRVPVFRHSERLEGKDPDLTSRHRPDGSTGIRIMNHGRAVTVERRPLVNPALLLGGSILIPSAALIAFERIAGAFPWQLAGVDSAGLLGWITGATIMLVGAVYYFLRAWRVTATPERLELARGLGSPRRERSWPARTILSVRADAGPHWGFGSLSWALVFEHRDGTATKLDAHLADGDHARWIAASLERALRGEEAAEPAPDRARRDRESS